MSHEHFNHNMTVEYIKRQIADSLKDFKGDISTEIVKKEFKARLLSQFESLVDQGILQIDNPIERDGLDKHFKIEREGSRIDFTPISDHAKDLMMRRL